MPSHRLVTAALVLAPVTLLAQQPQPAPRPGGAGGPGGPGGPPRAAVPQAPGSIAGTVVVASTAQGIPSASITVRLPNDTALVAGALTKADGSFRVEGLRPGAYTVRVRVLGYAPQLRERVAVTAAQPKVDLGRIALEPVAAQLSSVQVQGEREQASLAPDRNSYSVKDMPATSGGTAVDVLRNVPSVEVDGDNKVSLRGNQNVVVQLNGRASPMRAEQLGNFLAQLPANVVSKVEVVSNPSAKDDPEGVAGIINIVLKQEADLGTSGGVTVGGGSTQQMNASGNLGRQAGKWTLFSSYGFMRDRRTVDGFSTRDVLSDEPSAATSLDADMHGFMRPQSHSGTLTTEYKATQRQSLSNNLVVNRWLMSRDNRSFYRSLDGSGVVTGRTNELTGQSGSNLNLDEAVTWRRVVTPQKNQLSVEGRVNYGHGTNDLLLTEQARSAAGEKVADDPDALETNLTDDRNTSYFAQTDWTRELRPGTKLESGYKGTFRRQSTDFDVATGVAGGALAPDLGRTNAFQYRENINAAYAVLSQKAGKVDLQGGLRVEQATTNFDLRTTGKAYDNAYHSAFPSAIVAWNLDAQRQVKASYSRRINRPFAQQLNPFGFREDAVTVFEGNPALKPEYTDSYELGWQQSLGRRGTLQLTPFARHTTDAVRQISFVDTANVLHMTSANAATSDQYGADANLNFHLGAVTGFGGASVYQVSTDAANLVGARDVRTVAWSARGNGTWKATPTLDLQGFAMYRAPMKTEQGRMSSFTLVNLAMKQKLRGDKASATLRIMDPFGTMGWAVRTNDGRVVQLMDRQFGARGAFLSFNWNFGQAPKLRPPPRQDDGGSAQQPGMPGPP